jgi:metal-responsive CopG/Arc/MetJ family transcriptional regulator
MKSHISATLESDLLEHVDRFAREEKRSRSQIIEIALEQFLRERTPSESEIVTSSGRFEGPFSREETYAR